MACWSNCVPKTSNLERFLQCATPVVPAKTVPKSSMQNLCNMWQISGKDTMEYFTLGDVWRWYDECSAWGMGTSVVLENGEDIMQFYVPYLSSMQIYAHKSALASRMPKEDRNGGELESDSWSDDSGSDQKSMSNKSWDAGSEDSNSDQEATWAALKDRSSHLYFEYFETCSPYSRVPLSDKVTELTRKYPALMTLRSVDLLPASWVSVAWYPIYQIPSKKEEKDLATCFLTFHTLSSCFQDIEMDCSGAAEKVTDGKIDAPGKVTVAETKRGSKGVASLTPFGLATLKSEGDLWLDPEKFDHERTLHLNSAADSWLKQLDVYHHDFNFFTNHSNM